MGAYSDLSDSELAKRLDHQDEDVANAAFKQVYLRYWGGLYHHASKLLKDEAQAEDIVHDLFASLIEKRGNLHIDTPIGTYLYKAVRNRVINAFRKDKHRQKYIDIMRPFFEKGEFATDEAILEHEMKKRIEDAVAQFPPKMREAFELSRKGDLSRLEIAKATGNKVGTVNTQLNRAFKILRSKLTAIFFF